MIRKKTNINEVLNINIAITLKTHCTFKVLNFKFKSINKNHFKLRKIISTKWNLLFFLDQNVSNFFFSNSSFDIQNSNNNIHHTKF